MNGLNGIDLNPSIYFESYEDLDIHQLMLTDKPRTLAYKNAIFNMKDQFDNKIVMDVGAGTGILSIFCAQAGAKKVYAVEASNLAELIPKVAEENNVQEKIQIMPKRIEDVDPKDIEKVDILVSEWMGFYLLHEGMLDSVIVARDRFLKHNGLLFPSIAKIYAAPCQLPIYFENWDDVYGVSMKCFAENYRQSKSLKPDVLILPENDLLSEGKLMVQLDLKTVKTEELNHLEGKQLLVVCKKDGNYQGLAVWFDVEFPDGSLLSTAPTAEPTHWKQTIIILPYSINVNEKEPIAFELKLDRNDENKRKYNIAFTMLDEDEAVHDVPCDCYMTKCITIKEFIKKSSRTLED